MSGRRVRGNSEIMEFSCVVIVMHDMCVRVLFNGGKPFGWMPFNLFVKEKNNEKNNLL